MNTTDESGPINGVKLSVKDYTGWDFRIWPKKILGRFAGTKRSYAGFHRTLGKKK